jgi:hypothetical protein
MISQIENREEAGRLQHLAHRLEVGALFALLLLVQPAQGNVGNRPMLAAPIWVYNNWSAYGELSDEVPLNEELAMRELGEMLRLRKAGVHFGYYMMDAFWYDPDGGCGAGRVGRTGRTNGSRLACRRGLSRGCGSARTRSPG